MEQSRQQQAERLSILSSCCGVTGEVTLTDSAVILLFASALGAGDVLTLVTTSVLPFFNGLLIIPAAWFVSRIGRGKLISWSCSCAAVAYFLAASAPFFGRFAIGVLIAMIVGFALSLPGFIAGWFPLLDSFLPETRRTAFLGRMRFLHQLSAIGFLLLVSLVIGRTPSIPLLQGVLFAGAVIFLGRLYFIARIPHFEPVRQDIPWGPGLRAAVGNRELTRFSIYQFVLNLLLYGTIPVATLYLKKGLGVADNIIVFISGAALAGMLLGYLAANRLKTRIPVRRLFLGLHLMTLPVNLVLFFLRSGTPAELVVFTAMLMLSGFAVAASSVVCSAEMMALAAPGNKTMAMAWSGAFFYCGCGSSQLLSSFFLGQAPLHLGTWTVTPYQELFLLYAALLIPALCLLFRIPGERATELLPRRKLEPMIRQPQSGESL